MDESKSIESMELALVTADQPSDSNSSRVVRNIFLRENWQGSTDLTFSSIGKWREGVWLEDENIGIRFQRLTVNLAQGIYFLTHPTERLQGLRVWLPHQVQIIRGVDIDDSPWLEEHLRADIQ